MVAVSHFLTTMNRRPWMKHIGFDVDSTTTHISVFSERGREILHTKIATREADLVAFMRSIPGPKRVTLEESQMADFVTRIIEPYAAKVIRCLPQHNRSASCFLGVSPAARRRPSLLGCQPGSVSNQKPA
jgi:hypothetical protein